MANTGSPQFVPQVISRIMYFLPVYDRVIHKNVNEMFEDIADDSVFDTLCLAPISRYLLDLKSLMIQLKTMIKRQCTFWDPQLGLAKKNYQNFLLEVMESNASAISNLVAFYVNVGDEEACTRLRDIVCKICESNASTINRVGCVNLVRDEDTDSWMHAGGYPDRKASTYAKINGLFGSLPRVSVLYLSSVKEFNRMRSYGSRFESHTAYSKRLKKAWAPIAESCGLENLRHIHFFENLSTIQECMTGFAKPFGQLELVTLSEIKIDMCRDVKDIKVLCERPKLRTVFPNAVILPRVVRFDLNSLLGAFGEVEEGETSEECRAMFREMVRVIENCEANGVSSVSMVVERLPDDRFGPDLDTVQELGVVLDFEAVLGTLSRTSRSSVELILRSNSMITWKEPRRMLEAWATHCGPRPRGTRNRITLLLDEREYGSEFDEDFGDDDEDDDENEDNNDEDDDENNYSEGAWFDRNISFNKKGISELSRLLASISREPPTADAAPTESAEEKLALLKAKFGFQKCLRTLWRTLDVENYSEVQDCIKTYADAYYVDVMRKRFSWLQIVNKSEEEEAARNKYDSDDDDEDTDENGDDDEESEEDMDDGDEGMDQNEDA